MNRQAQSVVLLLVGGAVLRISLSDICLRYVRAGLRPFLVATALVLVLTAVATLWYELRAVSGGPDRPGEADARTATAGATGTGTATDAGTGPGPGTGPRAGSALERVFLALDRARAAQAGPGGGGPFGVAGGAGIGPAGGAGVEPPGAGGVEPGESGSAACCAGCAPATHGAPEPWVGWLLLLPVLGLVLVAPPALGSYAASRSGSVPAGPAAGATGAALDAAYPALSGPDPVRLGLLDYAARAAFDEGRTLAGHRLALTGFITVDAAGTRYLTRMVLACCAADARPIKVGMTGLAPGRADAGADVWIEVIGRYTPLTGVDPVNGETVAFVSVESWQRVLPPASPYDTT